MFENLKSMTDDDVINVINTIVTDNIDVELADLKLILAEASGRKLEKKYINIIAERIKSKIQPEPVEYKRRSEPVVKPAPEVKVEAVKAQTETKPTFDDVYSSSYEEEEIEEYEKYPALSFLSGMYKILAWVMLILCVVGSIGIGFIAFKGIVYLVCAMAFCGIVTGLILLLSFYSMAESIKVRLDTEEHLREIKSLLKK